MNSMSTKQSRNKLASHSSHKRELQTKHWRKVRHSSALAIRSAHSLPFRRAEQLPRASNSRDQGSSYGIRSITAPLQFDQPVFLGGSLSIRVCHSEMPVTC